MHNYTYDYIDELERRLSGKPALKEHTVGPESLLTVNQVVNAALQIMAKEMAKDKVKVEELSERIRNKHRDLCYRSGVLDPKLVAIEVAKLERLIELYEGDEE